MKTLLKKSYHPTVFAFFLFIFFSAACASSSTFASSIAEKSSTENSSDENSSEKNYSEKNSTPPKKLFEQLFNQWTHDFNRKDLDGSCSLFAKSVKAKYRGLPEKNFDDICNGFSKIFNETNKNYSYSFELHDVYQQGNLAVVRITWYLQIKENEMNKSIVQDEGMDILQKNEKGQWQIVNYLAFPE